MASLLLGQLDQLESKAAEIGNEDPAKILEIKLKMARGWARQVVTNYLYEPGRSEGRR